jgi:hypothetical protein
MRYAGKTAIKANLFVDESRIPVIVDAREVVNLRDRRVSYEGFLWSTQMPISASLEGSLSLIFPDGNVKAIRIFSQYPYMANPPSTPELWDYFKARFLSADNISKRDEKVDAN